MVTRKGISILFLFFLLSSLTVAVIWSPQGNISLKNRYYITNDPVDACSLGEVVQGKNDDGTWNCTSTNFSIYNWEQNVNANAYSLTDLGELIMSGLITSYNIIPYTTELYSLGNSTNWFEEAYIRNLYSENINTSELNSTDVNSENVDVNENLTLKNITIKEESEDLIIILTE